MLLAGIFPGASVTASIVTASNENTYICSQGLQKEMQAEYNIGLHSSCSSAFLTIPYKVRSKEMEYGVTEIFWKLGRNIIVLVAK